MSKKIGFTSDPGRLIEDVVDLVFDKRQDRQAVNSTRYACEVKVGKTSKTFDLYLPNILMHGKAPKRLQMLLRSAD